MLLLHKNRFKNLILIKKTHTVFNYKIICINMKRYCRKYCKYTHTHARARAHTHTHTHTHTHKFFRI